MLITGIILTIIGVALTIIVLTKQRAILSKANTDATELISSAQKKKDDILAEASELISSAEKKKENILAEASELISSAEKKKENILAEASELISSAEKKKEDILAEANQAVIPFEERIEQLKMADKEVTLRLQQSKAIIENLTDRCRAHAADIELLSETHNDITNELDELSPDAHIDKDNRAGEFYRPIKSTDPTKT